MVRFTQQAGLNYQLCDPDVRLMLRVRDGDVAAFEELWLRYHQRVRLVLDHLMGNRHHTEDLAQEVFLRVFRARNTYVATSKFTTWLFTIVNNVVSNARRSLATRRTISLLATDCGPRNGLDHSTCDTRGELPDYRLEGQELSEVVHRAVSQLNQRQRTAVTLCSFEEMSHSDAALVMNTSAEAVKSLLHRARMSLRAQLATYMDQGVVKG